MRFPEPPLPNMPRGPNFRFIFFRNGPSLSHDTPLIVGINLFSRKAMASSPNAILVFSFNRLLFFSFSFFLLVFLECLVLVLWFLFLLFLPFFFPNIGSLINRASMVVAGIGRKPPCRRSTIDTTSVEQVVVPHQPCLEGRPMVISTRTSMRSSSLSLSLSTVKCAAWP